MRIGLIPLMLLLFVLSVYPQENDSIKNVALEGVTVVGNAYKKADIINSTLFVDVIEKDFLREHFTGNFMQTLGHVPGVRSMDIGSGFSKPMIRGMAFNRISVVENGLKQEGQQWGADHGFEMDAFNVESVIVRKGASSLLYGSDAMGGVIEISQLPAPKENQIFGEASLLGKSVNETLGGSIMLGIKKNAWYAKFRYTESHFGDYRIPTDTIVYLTMRMPVYGRRLKNTAGVERDVSLYAEYKKSRYYSNYLVSNAYQKNGFFPGAHGIPDISRVQHDGSHRDIDMPYSKVNHFKASTRQQYTWDKFIGSWDFGYQNNHREEWSEFHTHYDSQPMPDKDPDKELAFDLSTYSSALKLRTISSTVWEHTVGWDIQYQENNISGYSFLLPQYERFTTGVFWLTTWRVSNSLLFSGGIRYDYGKINVSSFRDSYLEVYLQNQGYSKDLIDKYTWRSYQANRHFSDFSGSMGLVWNSNNIHLIKANIGRSFRLPIANELAANGVHHGAFRHEQGDPSLSSERGWQLDASYAYDKNGIRFSVSPFINWFSNYIYLKPTGEWSILPHAGQIYRYTGAEVILAGGELSFDFDFLNNLNYRFAGEYVYTYNQDEKTPLSFSPPASMRNTLTWKNSLFQTYAEVQTIASQNRVSKNEARTSGANLFHLGAIVDLPLGFTKAEVTLSFNNMFNTKYYNHLSFYRKVEIPEPGRNFQILIKIPFKSKLK